MAFMEWPNPVLGLDLPSRPSDIGLAELASVIGAQYLREYLVKYLIISIPLLDNYVKSGIIGQKRVKYDSYAKEGPTCSTSYC